MAFYEIFNNDQPFVEHYSKKPHLYKRHEKSFNEMKDEYLELANSFHPKDYNEWRSSLGKLYKYEQDLYAKVDKHKHLIIVSYYVLNQYRPQFDYSKNSYINAKNELYMRFIYDTETTAMYHYREKRFKYVAYVLQPCSGKYQFGGFTDMDRFYLQKQRKLDDQSINVLKSLEQFKYLPIEKFYRINVYRLFQVNEDTIYQYEILIKNGLNKLASDLLLERSFIRPQHFKRFKEQIMSGIRLNELNRMINEYERKEDERKQRIKKKNQAKEFAKMPKQVYDIGEYIIRHPLDAKELEREGRELHHCVASYLERIVHKKTDVLFLRKKSEPDKPYFTIEISDNRVTQVRTFKNKTDKEITELVNHWNEERIGEVT